MLQRILEALILCFMALIAVASCGLFLALNIVYAHDHEIIHCSRNFVVNEVEKIDEEIMENGLVAEAYDTDAFFPLDGLVDLVTYSIRIPGSASLDADAPIAHREHPLLYEVDMDRDRVPDAVYVDKYGRGECTDIVLYQDLRIPRSERRYDAAPGGKL